MGNRAPDSWSSPWQEHAPPPHFKLAAPEVVRDDVDWILDVVGDWQMDVYPDGATSFERLFEGDRRSSYVSGR